MNNKNRPTTGDRITFKVQQRKQLPDGKFTFDDVTHSGIVEHVSAKNFHYVYTVKKVKEQTYYRVTDVQIKHIWGVISK